MRLLPQQKQPKSKLIERKPKLRELLLRKQKKLQ
jgi:hypothetical protein